MTALPEPPTFWSCGFGVQPEAHTYNVSASVRSTRKEQGMQAACSTRKSRDRHRCFQHVGRTLNAAHHLLKFQCIVIGNLFMHGQPKHLHQAVQSAQQSQSRPHYRCHYCSHTCHCLQTWPQGPCYQTAQVHLAPALTQAPYQAS